MWETFRSLNLFWIALLDRCCMGHGIGISTVLSGSSKGKSGIYMWLRTFYSLGITQLSFASEVSLFFNGSWPFDIPPSSCGELLNTCCYGISRNLDHGLLLKVNGLGHWHCPSALGTCLQICQSIPSCCHLCNIQVHLLCCCQLC